MHEIHSSNPPVVTGIFDPNKSQARHHCRFVLKTKYETDKSGLEKKISNADKKIPDTSRLFKKTDYNSKVSEIESKIPSISGLATTSALTKVENEIPNVGNLVKKKQIIIQKYHTLKVDMLLQPITVSLVKISLIII